MNPISYIVIGLILIVIYNIYATIIKRRNNMDEAYANIDVQFKKRADLLPNILTIAKRFMEHEKALLEEITKLRTSALELASKDDNESVKQRFDVEQSLEQKMKALTVSVENYPELRSQEVLIEAQQTYRDVENNLAAARRYYNSAIASLRNSVQIFPSNIINALFVRAVPKPMFEADAQDRQAVDAGNYLG